jgi:nucleotide-binding universal stress UspA family protein
MFRRILVGFDGSRDARDALRVGAELASVSQGEISVLMVVSAAHGETQEERQAAFDREAGSLQELAERELDTVMRRHSATTSMHVVASDHPDQALPEYALKHGYDLVVLGRHGRERAMHGGLGWLATSVSQNSSFPVLLVGDGDQLSG